MADNLTPLPVKTKTDGDVAVDVAQYGGSAVGAANALHVQPGTGATFTLAANSGVDIGDVDVTSIIPGTGATNLGKAEDASHTTGDVGVMALAVQQTADAALAGTTGDYAPLQVDENGYLKVNIKAGAGSGGTAMTDDAAFTPASTPITPMGAFFDDVAPDSVDEGDGGVVRMSANRNLYTQIRDAAGNERGANVDASNNLNVILAANSGVDIGDVDLLSGPTGANALEVQGTAADGAAAVGDPVRIGGTDGSANVQNILTDTDGHLQVDVLTGGEGAAPTNPATEDVTSASLAAGASVDLDSTDVGASTLKLTQVDIAASVPWKARIMTVANAVETIHTVLFGQPNTAYSWKPPHKDYVQQGPAGAGFDGFRVEMTNLDNADSADVYCTIYTEE